MAQCGLLETEKQVIKYLEGKVGTGQKRKTPGGQNQFKKYENILQTLKFSNFLAVPGVHSHTYMFTEVSTTLKLSSVLNSPLVDLHLLYPDTSDP